MNTQNKILSFILCITIVFTVNTAKPFVPTTHAWWGILDASADPAAVPPNYGTWGAALGSLGQALAKWVADNLANLASMIASITVVTAKVLALLTIQKVVASFTGDDGGGSGSIIRDYNNYLYVSPQQRAMTQMTNFFNTVSRGRLSSLNYEGIGPNYDSYLVAQARQAISGQAFVTNIQQQVTDPRQMFSGGNMKGIMSYMQCANNVACYTLTASAQYDKEFTKAQDLARSEQQNGFLPTKAASGRITKPAALAQNALLQIDQLGTQLIMNAQVDPKSGSPIGALTQIAEGTVISIASRAVNYGISDNEGKAAIVAQNNQFPFSLGYSSLGGVNLNAGGVKINTNLGSVGTGASGQIGNTAVQGGMNCNAAGCQVTSSTRRVQ